MCLDPSNTTIAALGNMYQQVQREVVSNPQAYHPKTTLAEWQRPFARLKYESLCRGEKAVVRTNFPL